MEFKKIEFQIDDKTYTIASVEDFIDIELAGMEEFNFSSNMYNTPCYTYFSKRLEDCRKQLEMLFEKNTAESFAEFMTTIFDLYNKANGLMKYILDVDSCMEEVQSKVEEIDSAIETVQAELDLQNGNLGSMEKDIISKCQVFYELICNQLESTNNSIPAILDFLHKVSKVSTRISCEEHSDIINNVVDMCHNAYIKLESNICKELGGLRTLFSSRRELTEIIGKLNCKIEEYNEKKKKFNRYNIFNSNAKNGKEYKRNYLSILNETLDFFNNEIPAVLGREYIKLSSSGNEKSAAMLLSLHFVFLSTIPLRKAQEFISAMYGIPMFGEKNNSQSSNDKNMIEYIVSVSNWMKEPTVKDEEKETIKDLAYRLLTENVYISNMKYSNEHSLSGTIWGNQDERDSRIGKGYRTDVTIPDEEHIILDYFTELSSCVYGHQWEYFEKDKIDKDHLLMFDYAKAYLLYDLILSNRIEFLDEVPQFVEEIRRKGRVRELKPINTAPEQPTEE